MIWSYPRQERGLGLALIWSEAVDTGHWQALKGVPQTKTMELQNVVVEVGISETVQALQELINPNLPFAEEQFLERVSGVAHNPPPSFKLWPWYQSGKVHQTEVEPEVDERDWAYLAALIDADGSITFPQASAKVHPRIRVSWVTKQELRDIQSIFNVGTLCERRHKGNYADQIIWQIQAVHEVKWVLEHILPYLRLKGDKARDALSRCDYKGRASFPKSDPQFSHSYPERFWPPRGHGIRYRYGDLNDVVSLLAREPYTRQAVLPVFFPEDTGAHHGERIPCSLYYQFMLRNSRLHCNYTIRSCDFLRHMVDDIYLAARLCQWVLGELQDLTHIGGITFDWNDVKPGKLTMMMHSLHVFAGDLPKMRKLYG